MTGGAALTLQGLVKRYAGLAAVAGVDLDVAPGEFVSFLGPSGSGKTTTLMMIAGFVIPDGGAITLAGADITRTPPYRRNIGMVYQSYALFPHMTVAKNVAFPLRMRGVARSEIARRVERALGVVQLGGLADRLPAQLSGGQQQRVALARAMVFEPPLLLMDEPLGALDKKLREELQVEIKRIQRETRSTVVYVTHDQEEALSMSDRVVVMRAGRIEQVGSPRALYETPATRFVADFLGAANFLEAEVVERGSPALLRTAAGTLVRAARAETGGRVTVAIRPERIRVVPAGHAGETGETRHAALVEDASYHGNVQRFDLVLGGGDRLACSRPNLGEPLLAPGSAVTVTWRAEDAWVLPPESGT